MLEHDEFGLHQSKFIVIDSNNLELDEENRFPPFLIAPQQADWPIEVSEGLRKRG
ncbi:MAG: hypothetical protein ACLPID_08165 [Beijerinckiaceae bacterium]